MIKQTLFNLFFVLFLFACKTSQLAVTQMQSASKDENIQIDIPSTIIIGQQLNIQISTNLDEGIILYDPMLLQIERFENDEWSRLHIIHCPCGANCSAPPREQIINKCEAWSISWNLIESWCENVKEQDIPRTIEIQSGAGKYRLLVNYGLNTQERIKITKEFQIIN